MNHISYGLYHRSYQQNITNYVWFNLMNYSFSSFQFALQMAQRKTYSIFLLRLACGSTTEMGRSSIRLWITGSAICTMDGVPLRSTGPLYNWCVRRQSSSRNSHNKAEVSYLLQDKITITGAKYEPQERLGIFKRSSRWTPGIYVRKPRELYAHALLCVDFWCENSCLPGSPNETLRFRRPTLTAFQNTMTTTILLKFLVNTSAINRS